MSSSLLSSTSYNTSDSNSVEMSLDGDGGDNNSSLCSSSSATSSFSAMSDDPTSELKVESFDDGDSSGSIKLQSKDGKSFDVDRKNAFISTLVKTGLDTGILYYILFYFLDLILYLF